MKRYINEPLDILDVENLCDYCPLDDGSKHARFVPNSISIGCEGCCCEEAYENYIASFIEDEE
jgi:hypothetical protein